MVIKGDIDAAIAEVEALKAAGQPFSYQEVADKRFPVDAGGRQFVRLLLLFATWPLGHLPPLLTYTAYDYCISHSLLLTKTV
jgi:hypothetical protein